MNNKLSLYAEHLGFEKGWIVKVLRLLPQYADLFRRTDRQILLGIGPNKIKGLYQWLKGMEIIEGSGKEVKLTPIGQIIKEYDEYLREYGTWIALIHNLSVYPPHSPAGFYWFFNELNKGEFSREDMKSSLFESELFSHLKDSSKEEGLRGLLAGLRNSVISEELGLFEEVERNRFRKGYPSKGCFHPLVFAYCVVDWAKRNGEKEVVQIEEIISSKGMPGRIFNLPERDIQEKLDEVDMRYSKRILDVERFAGLNRTTLKIKDPLILLKFYYEEEINKNPLSEELLRLSR